jgi:hypothetical protein
MLSTSGVVYLRQDPVERKTGKGIYFNTVALAKDPRGGKAKVYRLSIWVPDQKLESAREGLSRGNYVQLRHGELDGTENEAGHVFSQVTTKWDWVEILGVAPQGGRKQ